jgi:hypothetical protein
MTVTEKGRYIIVEVTDLQNSVRWDRLNEITIQLDKKWQDVVSHPSEIAFYLSIDVIILLIINWNEFFKLDILLHRITHYHYH